MKKNILFFILFAVISFSACKKERTCSCITTTTPGSSTSTTETQSHLTKKNAKRVMNCYSYTESTTVAGTPYTKTVECEIK